MPLRELWRKKVAPYKKRRLREKYYGTVQKSISIAVASRFYQIEAAINVGTRMELYSDIPLLEKIRIKSISQKAEKGSLSFQPVMLSEVQFSRLFVWCCFDSPDRYSKR